MVETSSIQCTVFGWMEGRTVDGMRAKNLHWATGPVPTRYKADTAEGWVNDVVFVAVKQT